LPRHSGIWVARVTTRNFEFEAFGRTEREALGALQSGWEIHRRQTRATLTWRELMDGGAVDSRPVHFGQCYRDGEEINAENIRETVS
jgi:hypothetical protein